MLAGRLSLFAIVFLKTVDALVDCNAEEYCVVPIGETFRVSLSKSNADPFDCSEVLEWYFNDPNTTLKNGSNGLTIGCQNNTAGLEKKDATLSDSGKYGFEYERRRRKAQFSGEVLIFSATLKTQPKEDGKHRGVLLQLQLPPPPLNEPPKLRIEGFNCPSTDTNIPMYMNDPQWKLLDVGLGDESNLCCHFNVTNGSRSWSYSIRPTPGAAPNITLCHSEKSPTRTTLPSTSLGTEGPKTAPILGGLNLSPPMQLLSTAVTTIIVSSVFHLV